MVARWAFDRLRRLDRCWPRPCAHGGGRRRRGAQCDHVGWPLCAAQILARWQDDRVRKRPWRRVDGGARQRKPRRLSRGHQRRRGGADHQGRQRTAVRRPQRSHFPGGAGERQAPTGQHRLERRGEARPRQRGSGQRLHRVTQRRICRVPAELPGVRDAADARHAGGRCRQEGWCLARDASQRRWRGLHQLVE